MAVTPRYPDVPERVEKRTVADLGDWPYPKHQLVPLTEVVHDRLNVEVFRGCTRGCRFCQAGMITRPVRERPEEQVRTMVRDGLRRTGYDEVDAHLAVDGRLQRHRARRGRHGERPDRVRAGEREPPVAAGRRLHGRHRGPGVQGPPHRPHVRARGGHVAPAPGDQQADPRGRPLRRRGVGLLAGLGPDEAVLPHRAAHRDRRGHARASPSWPATASRSASGTPTGRRSPPASAASCPSPTPRSSGSARTRWPSCGARSACCATPPRRPRACS